MRSKHLLILLLLALIVPWAANAQSVTIGSGTAKSPYVPGYNYYNYAISQQIYTAEEINASGTITSIAFYKDGTENSNGSRKYDIYMAHTTKTGFEASTSTTKDWIALTDADLVYHGTANYSFTNNAWNTFTLETPFNYNGTDNLVICVIDRTGNCSSSSSSANQFRVFSTGSEYQAIYQYNDYWSETTPTPDGYNGSNQLTYTRLTTKNQIVLGGIQQTCAKPTGLTATLDDTDHTIATLGWTENGQATSWVLQYSEDNTFTTGVQSFNISGTPSKDLTGLTAETVYYARVRPSCSETLWSDVCEFKPTAVITVPIGDGASSGYELPVNTYYNYSLTQQIYTAAEIQAGGGSAGTINSISFYHDYANTTPKTMNGIKAYLLNTDKDAFTSSTDMVAVTDADKVWEGNITLNGKGWVTIDFTTPFEYDGDNLIVCMYYPTKEYPGSSHVFRHTATTYYSSVYYYDDNDSNIPDLNNINTYGGSKAYQKYHNNIQLGIIPTNTPKPKNLQYSNVTATAATLSWEEPNIAPTKYAYQYKAGAGDYNALTETTGLSVNLSLTASTTYTFRVKAIYDGVGDSDFVETTFTTLDACAFPTNFVATTTPGQGTKATFTWTKGYDEDAWVLQYATNDAFTEGRVEVTTGFTVEGNNVTANLTGLTAETKYYARVKATCSATSSSNWSNVVDFTPTNYKDFTFGETAYYTSSYVPFYGSYASSSPLLSQFIIPAAQLADVAGGTIRRMTFYSSTATASWGDAKFSVYVKEVEATTFASSNAEGLEDWESMNNVYNGSLSISGNQMVIEFANNFTYNGGNLMIGFNETVTGTSASASWYYVSGASNSTLYAYYYYSASYSRGSNLPKVTFNYQPTSTPRPIITEPVPTTDVTATVAWTKPADDVTGYKYQYKLAADTWTDDWTTLNDANAVSVTVPNLTPNSNYDFRMKAVYAAGESFISTTSFATACPVATPVPYTYGFETAPEFNCWTVATGSNVNRTSNYPHEGSYSLVFYGTQLNEIEMPLFAQPTNTLRLEYWVRPEGYQDSRSGSFAIGYYNATNEFVALKTYAFNSTTGQYDDWESTTYIKQHIEFDVDADNDGTPDVPADAHIVFRQFNTTSYYYWMVDDVKVKVIPTCEDVDNVHCASYTNHSANIAWDADAGQSAWQIAYKDGANFDPNDATELATATIVDATANPYLFDMTLEAATTYYMYVRANCTASSDGYGDWSDSYATFTTFEATPAPSSFTASNLASQQVDLKWVEGGGDGETSWDLYYVNSTTAPTAPTSSTPATETVTTMPTPADPYVLDGLSPETTYYIWVRSNYDWNSTTSHSDWVALTGDSFTTLNNCPTPNNVEIDANSITAVEAIVTWVGSMDVSSYTVEYGEEGTYSLNETEDFSAYTATTYDAAGSLPEGWKGYSSGSYKPHVSNNSVLGGSYDLDGFAGGQSSDNNFLYMIGNSTGTYSSYTILPKFSDLTAVSFDYGMEDASRGTLTVGYCTDNADGSTFTPFDDLTLTGSKNSVTVNLTATDIALLNANNGYLTFRWVYSSGYGVGIDNITIKGGTYTPGDVETETTDEQQITLTGLTPNKTYNVRVKSDCTGAEWSTYASFTTLPDGTKVFKTTGEWGTAANWSPSGAPALTDDVILRADATIENGCVATANSIAPSGNTLTIADGGQLQTNTAVTATVKKNITGYGAGNEANRANYYLIGNPLSSYISSGSGISATGMTTGSYDLYQWNYSATDGNEWRNYEVSTFSLYNGTGYLYANEGDVELTFTGSVLANNTDVEKTSSYVSSNDYDFNGWSLFANPFVCNAYVKDANTNLAFYRMNTAGDGFEAATGAIAPMEGIFVQATATEQTFKFTRTAPESSTGNGNLNITMAQVVTTRDMQPATDNAIVRFDGGLPLGKFSFREGSSKGYIPQDGKDYAVVNAQAQGELPLNFKAEQNGTYTLSFGAENVTFSYLHLIDNMTGADVDLLATPSYTFDARLTDYASRFRLVFATGSSVTDDSFAFINGNGNLCIFGIEGTATLQVIDVTGRILSSETFSGNYEKKIGGASGVYMIRLIDGNDVKVQKIVVR